MVYSYSSVLYPGGHIVEYRPWQRVFFESGFSESLGLMQGYGEGEGTISSFSGKTFFAHF